MKVNNIFKKVVLGACAVLMLGSCNDFLTIYPTDKTVAEDFWKKKEDVDEMVTGAYSAMIAYNVQERCIVWGALRSDELVKRTSYSSSTIDNVLAMNLLPSNSYNTWASFYAVINRCNIVLNHAAGVMDEDPEFTQGDYDVVRGQMLALRSLCYFYLVRAFRDVPYTTQSFEDDDQEMQMAQMCPDSVLENCITDLKEAETKVMRAGAYGSGTTSWRNTGYITRDAVYAILADIYLWRASMNHSQSDYENCIAYADKLINSKNDYYNENSIQQVSGADKDIYHLIDGRSASSRIFSNNSSESILEWQYDGDRNSNTALENYYDMAGSSSSHDASGIVEASQIFNSVGTDANSVSGSKVYASKNDYRFWNNVYLANSSEALQLEIRKYVNNTSNITDIESRNMGPEKSSNLFDNYQRDWIVYRLTDVMLMKAEAQVQTAANDSDNVLRSAFDIVQTVNKRSMISSAKDTLKFSDFNSKASMEELVLCERERELCFEGKRWFDLVRYAYRHMDGVNSKQKMADVTTWPSLPRTFTSLIVRKYDTGGDAVSYKMKSEPYLYWPVARREIHVNLLLKQNPVYSDNETSSKN